jgi:hypothetical protein
MDSPVEVSGGPQLHRVVVVGVGHSSVPLGTVQIPVGH